MTPRETPTSRPLHLRIADDLRIEIEDGTLPPGSPLPTLTELARRYTCSVASARGAIALLKSQALILGGRGRPPVVRSAPHRVIRQADRHQIEKDAVLLPEQQRRLKGEAETNLDRPITDTTFTATYSITQADDATSQLFSVPTGTEILEREFLTIDSSTGVFLAHSLSTIPKTLVIDNPELLDEKNEPWPGGTMHQLSTVGIEIIRVIDSVSARAPTTVEQQSWRLMDGVPMIACRRLSFSQDDRLIEISDSIYPADRTELRFTTDLTPWSSENMFDVARGVACH